MREPLRKAAGTGSTRYGKREIQAGPPVTPARSLPLWSGHPGPTTGWRSKNENHNPEAK